MSDRYRKDAPRKAFVIDTDSFLRQSFAAATMAAEMFNDTLREAECWRMFGLLAEWDFSDCLTVSDPNTRRS